MKQVKYASGLTNSITVIVGKMPHYSSMDVKQCIVRKHDNRKLLIVVVVVGAVHVRGVALLKRPKPLSPKRGEPASRTREKTVGFLRKRTTVWDHSSHWRTKIRARPFARAGRTTCRTTHVRAGTSKFHQVSCRMSPKDLYIFPFRNVPLEDDALPTL